MLNIILIGPPGSGKGTQSEKISDMYGITHISTGDLFREVMDSNDNDRAGLIKKYVNNGDLVPDNIVIDMVIERLKNKDCENGYLLDGFPRSLNQAKIFDENELDKPVSHVILLDVDEDLLFKRLTGRRLAKKSGRIYNIYFNPPKVDEKCDESGEDLVIRDDDKEETVKNRLKVYKEQTYPLIKYYEDKKLLYRVNGNRNIEEVFTEIKEVFKS